MKLEKIILVILTSIFVMSVAVLNAQVETKGKPGSASATTTIDGKQIPPEPDHYFGGKIERNASESTPYWPPRRVAPEGAPNVLVILIDDAGYGVPSTFGGVIPTPTLDKLAENGLRYTNFHTTAVCSPTRSAVLTGHNHHEMGYGTISETATGYPGYNGYFTRDRATIGKILKENGYATSWYGKNHNTPAAHTSQAGPFHQWPTGMGFDFFYGFNGGDANHWQPNLVRNTTPIYPYRDNPGWNLLTAQADEAINWVNHMDALDPEHPFLIYYAPGATHSPHHPTPEWIEKIHDMHLFDNGWNALRDTIFANQKRLGVLPEYAKMTPWPDSLLQNWDDIPPNDQKMYIKQVEVFAAYAAYNDYEIGRVVEAIEDLGKLENTLVIYIAGDNGTSAEGGLLGTPNEVAVVQGVQVPLEDQLEHFYDIWGSEYTYNHMGVQWTWAFNTPFSWTKMVASHFGESKQGMVISWPEKIKDKGGIREQFHHVVDIVPTILEATNIKAPEYVDGIKQKPMAGVSMAYTFDEANEKAPSTHKTQYFEMIGDHAIYHDGWIASTEVVRIPWNNTGKIQTDPAGFGWELYDLSKDWTQYNDVADEYPKKLKELQDIFWEEAEKYQVLPLDATTFSRMAVERPGFTAGRNVFTYKGVVEGIPSGVAPSLIASSYNFKAEVEIPDGGGEGIIVTQGGRFAGYGFYVLKGKPVFTWNFFNLKRVKWQGQEELTPGKHVIEFDFTYDGMGAGTLAFSSYAGLGQGGTGVLKVDGKEVQTLAIPNTIPFTLQWDESFDVGLDTETGVDDQDYKVPFAFNGTIEKLTLTIDRPKLSPEDIKKLEEASQKSHDKN